ncbi:NAD(P)-dependent oxidoreductase [Dysgonomonas sp. ZJ709]|uniref:NAD(P)-dependent oxidoreductase n=1 Tax=Dysgonomonas sp. ZJ709 TaxID=2709797 RepID=UPI0013ED71D3|nr:NAD(P)H-binding protein [Dysgonomonas sp. ZJ709]
MKVALIGATGFVGSHILKELLTRKHEVTAIARNTDKIDIVDDKLTVASVNVIDTDILTDVLKGNTIVISAFNAGWDNPNIYEDYLNGYESIQKAIRAANIRRFFVVGNSGTLYEGGKQLVEADDFPTEMGQGAKASRDHFEKLRRETYLDWVYLAPPTDLNKEINTGRTGKFRLGRDEPIVREGVASISLEDLAMVVVDEVENRNNSRQQFTVGY